MRLAVAAVAVLVAASGCTAADVDEEPPPTDAAPETDASPDTDASPSTPEPLPDDDGQAEGAEDGADPAPAEEEVVVEVFFVNAGRGPETQVFPVERTVTPPAVLRGALEALLAGPTPEEELEGYRSFFSSQTADQLDDVTITDGLAEVSFSSELPELIPNASASAGSAALLAALDATTTQFDTVDEAVYSLEGDVDAFYEWLQLASPG